MEKDNKIYIQQPFREQYTLTIASEVNAVSALIISTVELRYDFQVLDIRDDHIEVRLLMLDNRIVKANNPMVKEVAQVSQVFGRMYNELHLNLSPKGKVLKVLNTDLILSKWGETKTEMQKYISGNPELEQAMSLNDTIFNSPEKVKVAVQANEFFQVYFGQIFEEIIPRAKKISGTNIFNTANLEWNINIDEMVSKSTEEKICISSDANPVRPFSPGYLNAAYHQFKEQLEINPLHVKMFQSEERVIERNTGKLDEAIIKKVEEVEPKKLYQKFTYKMISDTEKKLQQEKLNSSKAKEATPDITPEIVRENAKPEIYKVVEGKEFTLEEWKIYEERQWKIHQEKKKKKGFFGF
ncbi:hypothetical protein GCM10023210_14110 [Chryseobacterium ginsengisoli]|uniref:Uncharacterized protein n=1 Tax=Chryseobacterium ginsengisoli TaxID=363853 RepID=A0ABP9M5T1_9FLAO